MKKNVNRLKGFVRRFLIYRLYLNRGFSYANVPLQCATFGISIMTFLRVFGLPTKAGLAMIFISFTSILLVGLIDVKYGVMKMETTIKNEQNPEIQKILASVQQ